MSQISAHTLYLSGDYTSAGPRIPAARQDLLAAIRRHDRLVLDVRSVGEWDTAFIALLIEVYGEARRLGHSASLSGVGERLAQTFKLNLVHEVLQPAAG